MMRQKGAALLLTALLLLALAGAIVACLWAAATGHWAEAREALLGVVMGLVAVLGTPVAFICMEGSGGRGGHHSSKPGGSQKPRKGADATNPSRGSPDDDDRQGSDPSGTSGRRRPGPRPEAGGARGTAQLRRGGPGRGASGGRCRRDR